MKGYFTLPCNATGKNLTWTWKFNGGPLPDKVKIEKDTLVGGSRDNRLNVAHSGRYQCFVEDTKNMVSTFSREIEVKVTGSRTVLFCFLRSPVWRGIYFPVCYI